MIKKITSLLLLIIVFTTCNNKKTTSLTNSNKTKATAHRHLQEKPLIKLDNTTEQYWDSVSHISNKKIIYKKGKLDNRYKTFGWHPYYNGSAYKTYNFSMLWGISYHSYSIAPKTGNYKSIHQWRTTALIDSAKTHNCKTFLSISNFGKTNNTVFLKNLKAQNTLIDSVSNLLAFRKANGINIDFEGVSRNSKKEFTKFIILISKKLKKINPSYMISLSLYAVDWHAVFDINAIDSHIDFYTLMGYDYYGSFSKTTGPVTPFKTSEKFGYGLQSSINRYKNKGISLKKLIVGLPYYF